MFTSSETPDAEFRAARDLGWRPAETWATGFERTVAWYLSHFEWCAQVRSGDYQKWIAAHYG